MNTWLGPYQHAASQEQYVYHGAGPHEMSISRTGAHAVNTTSNPVKSDFLIDASLRFDVRKHNTPEGH
jgi:hypothetical protein